jgi:hypothetical protein
MHNSHNPRADRSIVLGFISEEEHIILGAEGSDPFTDPDDPEGVVFYQWGRGLNGGKAYYKRVLPREDTVLTCSECGFVGRTDIERGEVVCENDYCGVVISGDRPITLVETPRDGTHGVTTGAGAQVPPSLPEPDVQ